MKVTKFPRFIDCRAAQKNLFYLNIYNPKFLGIWSCAQVSGSSGIAKQDKLWEDSPKAMWETSINYMTFAKTFSVIAFLVEKIADGITGCGFYPSVCIVFFFVKLLTNDAADMQIPKRFCWKHWHNRGSPQFGGLCHKTGQWNPLGHQISGRDKSKDESEVSRCVQSPDSSCRNRPSRTAPEKGGLFPFEHEELIILIICRDMICVTSSTKWWAQQLWIWYKIYNIL